MGLISILISWICDGFLPDFQADIKINYKPNPLEMLAAINKWVSILTFCLIITNGKFSYLILFSNDHPDFLLHMLVMGILATCGQMFVYRLIKQFKQHILPFVLTTRKITSALISIFIYKHPSNIGQILAIFIIFIVVTL